MYKVCNMNNFPHIIGNIQCWCALANLIHTAHFFSTTADNAAQKVIHMPRRRWGLARGTPFAANSSNVRTAPDRRSTARGWWPAWAGAQNQRTTQKVRHGTRDKYIRNSVFISLYELFLFCPRSVPVLSPHCPRCPTPRKPAWMLDSSILSPLSPHFWRE